MPLGEQILRREKQDLRRLTEWSKRRQNLKQALANNSSTQLLRNENKSAAALGTVIVEEGELGPRKVEG